MNVELIEHFEKKACLITGGTGMIGRKAVQILCDAGADVIVVSLDEIIVDERRLSP